MVAGLRFPQGCQADHAGDINRRLATPSIACGVAVRE
jgi:hypothetical protein